MGLIDPKLANSFGTICIKDTCPDIDAATTVMTTTTVITPSNNKATFFKANDCRIVLIAGNLGRVDQKLGAGRIIVDVEALTPDIISGTTMAAAMIITPGNNNSAII